MKPLQKKIWRDIGRHPGQFASVAVIIICATALFVGMYSTLLNLVYSQQSYYRQYRFADIFVTLQRAPHTSLPRVASIPGVMEARGRIVRDVQLDVKGNPESVVGRIISMPRERTPVINDIHLVSGSYFTGANEHEVIVNERFREANGLQIGDSFEATLNGRRRRLVIAGSAYSPEYVYPLRSAEQLYPDDRNFGIIFVVDSLAERAFNMSGAFNDLSVIIAPDADADEIIGRIEARLDSYGVYAAFTREKQVSHYFLTEEIRGLRGTALIVPLAFLLVAALILHIMLARITEQQRAQIGTLMAMGYSRRAVAAHFMTYGAIVAFAGAITGVAAGFLLAGGMLSLYEPFFRFPQLINRFRPVLSLFATALTACTCLAGVLHTTLKVVKIQPAEAMKPKTPPSAHAVFLERFPPLWNRLGLVARTTIRTCLRAKSRSIVFALGVVISAMLLITGMASSDIFDYLMHHQFTMVDSSDLRVEFASEKPPGAAAGLASLPGVRAAEGILRIGVELRKDWKTKTLSVMGLPPESTMYSIYGKDGRPLPLPETGLVLPDYLMKEFRLHAGDQVELEAFIKDKPLKTVRIAAGSSEYIGLTAYADRRYLARLAGEGDMINGALLAADPARIDAVTDALKERPGIVSAVSQRKMIDSFMESFSDTMLIMAGAVTLIAALIAFAVIYSTSAINISEREREIATLIATGWSPGDASRMVTAEIIPMGLIGALLGLPAGRVFFHLLAFAFESDIYRFPTRIGTHTYIQVFALLMVFVTISRSICLRKAAKVNILKALKTRE